MTRPAPKLWAVAVRDADGRVVREINVTADLGWPAYDDVCRVLRTKLGDGQTLDTADADAQHRQLVVARVGYREAEVAWMLGRGGLGPVAPHPGSLADYLPTEAT